METDVRVESTNVENFNHGSYMQYGNERQAMIEILVRGGFFAYFLLTSFVRPLTLSWPIKKYDENRQSYGCVLGS